MNGRLTAMIFGLITILSVSAAAKGEPRPSPYAGEEKREIKTLSSEDISELREGKGWGLARAAELNGMPGPAHILELTEEIGLTPAQRSAIEKLYADMKERAVPLGLRLIEAERELNDAFSEGKITEEQLRKLLSNTASARRDLRFVHLSTHLRALPILTTEQVSRYNSLRGYSSGSNTPAGHDPEMWKRHRGGS